MGERELGGSTVLLLEALDAQATGAWEQVAVLADRAIAAGEAAGIDADVELALVLAAEAAFHLGDFEQARASAERALPLAEATGNRRALAATLVRLAALDVRDGDVERGEDRANDALVELLGVGDLGATLAVSAVLRDLALKEMPAFATFPAGDDLAERFPLVPAAPAPASLVNVGLPFLPLNLPFNGVRIRAPQGHSGWIVWSGRTEEMSYATVPIASLLHAAPEIAPYLRLDVSWRFQIAPGYEDVWFDELTSDDVIGE